MDDVERVLEQLAKPAHTYASENADHYRGFDAGIVRARQRVLATRSRLEAELEIR